MVTPPPVLEETPHSLVDAEAAGSAVLPEGGDAELIPRPPARAKAGLPPAVKQVLLAVGILVFGLLTLPLVPRIAAGLKEVLQIKEPEQEPVRPEVPYEKLGLPTIEEAEERMPGFAKEGKRLLAKIVKGDKEPFFLIYHHEAMLANLARGLSRMKTDKILGLRIRLNNVTPINDPGTQSDAKTTVKVTRIVDVTYRNIMLEVLDETSARTRVLRFTVDSTSRSPMGYGSLKKRLEAEFDGEMRCVRQACADTPPNRAVERRGLSVPHSTAVVAGAAPVTGVKRLCIYHKVQLMDTVHDDLESFRLREKANNERRLPAEAKDYIARRMLLEAMYLQETGVAHNDLSLRNVYVRRDGSITLGNFSSAAIFGEKRKFTPRLSAETVEPQTALEYLTARNRSEASVAGNREANLWSLGLSLCDVFTDGKMPYGYDSMGLAVGAPGPFQDLVEENPPYFHLRQILENSGTPDRWTELICRLARVRREDRITPKEIVDDYPDLLGLR